MTGRARTFVTILLVAAVGGLLILSTGCGGGASYEGPERAAVSGSVTLDGKPLPYGSILFMGQSGNRLASAVIQNGTYSLEEAQGPNLGEYSVQITGYAEAPPEATESEDSDDENAPDPDEAPAGEQIVPPQYNAQTTLKVTIASGKNTHDFALTSGGAE